MGSGRGIGLQKDRESGVMERALTHVARQAWIESSKPGRAWGHCSPLTQRCCQTRTRGGCWGPPLRQGGGAGAAGGVRQGPSTGAGRRGAAAGRRRLPGGMQAPRGARAPGCCLPAPPLTLGIVVGGGLALGLILDLEAVVVLRSSRGRSRGMGVSTPAGCERRRAGWWRGMRGGRLAAW